LLQAETRHPAGFWLLTKLFAAIVLDPAKPGLSTE
jgi:hypothetical protein